MTHPMRLPLSVLALCAAFWVAQFCTPAVAEEKSPGMIQYEGMAKEFVELRDVASRSLSPQELLTAAETLEGKVRTLADASAGEPSVKSKSLELLSMTCEFAGDAPGARQAYSQYLDVLEGWQGRDYAVMTVRRAGDSMLNEAGNPPKAIQYYDLLVEKYPGHVSRTHALYHSGLACLEAKSYTDAIQRFDQVVASAPESELAPWALRKKAHALNQTVSSEGDRSQSLVVLDELAAKYPTPHWKAYVYYRKGFTLAQQSKYLEAIAEYQKGIQEFPLSPYSIVGKRDVQILQGRIQQQILDELAGKERSPGDAAFVSPHAGGAINVALSRFDDEEGF